MLDAHAVKLLVVELSIVLNVDGAKGLQYCFFWVAEIQHKVRVK